MSQVFGATPPNHRKTELITLKTKGFYSHSLSRTDKLSASNIKGIDLSLLQLHRFEILTH